MSCALTSGFSIGCRDNIGGIVEFYVGNKPSDFAMTQDASGNITVLTGTGLALYTYVAEKNTAFVNEVVTNSRDNATSFVAVAATYVLNGQSQTKRNEIMLLAHSGIILIAKGRDGIYRLYGAGNTLTPSTIDVSSGTALGDRTGYTVNLVGEEPTLANALGYAVFSSFLS